MILFDDHERVGMNDVKKTPSLRRKRIWPKLCCDSQPSESVVRLSIYSCFLSTDEEAAASKRMGIYNFFAQL